MEKRLYVGSLNYGTDEADLRAHFERFGRIVEVKIIRDRDTAASKGFGFVEFDTEASAKAAIAELHEEELGGRKLTVTFAKAREARPPRAAPPPPDRDDRRGRGRGDDRRRRGSDDY